MLTIVPYLYRPLILKRNSLLWLITTSPNSAGSSWWCGTTSCPFVSGRSPSRTTYPEFTTWTGWRIQTKNNIYPFKSSILNNHDFHLKVKRFSEAFFVIQNTRSSALSCCESVYSKYQSVSSMLRCSKYLVNLPNLPVSCSALDGDVTNLPIIYEDKYQEDTTPKVSTSSVLTKSAEGFNAMENRRHSFSTKDSFNK